MKNVWIFFLLTFAITWIIWIPVAILNPSGSTKVIAIISGAFVPSLMGIVMIYYTRNKEGRHDFWKRLFDFRLISFNWYMLLIIIFPLISAVTILLCALLGFEVPAIGKALSIFL